ncbi:hypothetical protein [Enterococcus phage vB_EfKS5]|nr:hypothetical protein [Enterococcus phage vB_EfKS5]
MNCWKAKGEILCQSAANRTVTERNQNAYRRY